VSIPTQMGIDRQGLIFEGKRLPYWIAAEPVTVEVDEIGIAKITVTFLADSFNIDPLLTVETDGDVLLVSLEEDDQ
jgi:hypothetical protein